TMATLAAWPHPSYELPATREASVVVLAPQVRNQILALQVSQRVLQLHQLNEQIVLRVDLGSVHRALEVERQPLLDAGHTRALRQVQKEHRVEDDRRRQDAVPAQEIDLELHRI